MRIFLVLFIFLMISCGKSKTQIHENPNILNLGESYLLNLYKCPNLYEKKPDVKTYLNIDGEEGTLTSTLNSCLTSQSFNLTKHSDSQYVLDLLSTKCSSACANCPSGLLGKKDDQVSLKIVDHKVEISDTWDLQKICGDQNAVEWIFEEN